MEAPARDEVAVPPHVTLVLVVALVAVSSAGVLVRAAEGADPLAIALWRTTLVATLLLPAARPISRRDAALVALGGACLAAHFVTWFASLASISVMRSTVLVCLGPLWTGLMEWAVYRERPSRAFWIGLAVAVPGVALLAGTDDGPASLTGDVLATVGGMLSAAYLVVGRSVRARVGIGTYAPLVCVAAALCLLPVVIATGTPVVGFPATTWAAIVGLALGPQMLGHNGYNYALRYLKAATVSTVVLLEPVGATLLAAVFLGEVPGALAVVGGLLAIAGVIISIRR
jgi:drug/metabolite transporter (DMT)-like permease